MYNLTTLKAFFESQGVEILSFDGMFMHTSHGRWGMAQDEYYLDSKLISRKDIKKLVNNNV